MEIALLTDVGQKRTNNQDYVNHFVNRAGRTMIILADGMGGHRAGNIASEMAVTDLGVAWWIPKLTQSMKFVSGLPTTWRLKIKKFIN